jgi:hypothetical protein
MTDYLISLLISCAILVLGTVLIAYQALRRMNANYKLLQAREEEIGRQIESYLSSVPKNAEREETPTA